MTEPLARSPRQVAIADHLWETFNVISRDMGVDRDGLVNQALFAFARQNGYLTPAAPPRPVAEAAPVATPFSPTATAAAPYVAPSPVTVNVPTPLPQIEEPPAPAPVIAAPPEPPAPAPAKSNYISSLPAMDPVVFEDPLPPLNASMPSMKSAPPASAPAEPAPDFSAAADSGIQFSDPPAPQASEAPANAGVLVLYAEGRAVDRVTAPRFLIGRGKHCDLIINSGKVSREHAAIVREGEGYFIEDLGSSNGTWYDKKRITRRQIENGDEYFVCSEKISFRFE